MALRKPTFRPDLRVVWIYGPTGVGKRKARYREPETLFFIGKSRSLHVLASSPKYLGRAYWKPTGQWFDGYDDDTLTIMDDFRAKDLEYNLLLKTLDIYPHQVQVKGGFKAFNSTSIFITSNVSPQEMYSVHEDVNQLLRRIHFIFKLEAQGESQIEKGDVDEFYTLYPMLEEHL